MKSFIYNEKDDKIAIHRFDNDKTRRLNNFQ
jgi:hypothetical protein